VARRSQQRLPVIRKRTDMKNHILIVAAHLDDVLNDVKGLKRYAGN
jgi:hypothetical protein